MDSKIPIHKDRTVSEACRVMGQEQTKKAYTKSLLAVSETFVHVGD